MRPRHEIFRLIIQFELLRRLTYTYKPLDVIVESVYYVDQRSVSQTNNSLLTLATVRHADMRAMSPNSLNC